MADNYSISKKRERNYVSRKKLDAQKSLKSYVNQLKIHFDLNDGELREIIKVVFVSVEQKDEFIKKWWQIWK